MGCEMLFWNDVSDDYDHWVNLLRQLGGDSFINFEQDVWEQARQHEQPPHIGNIRQHLLLERLRETIEKRYVFLRVEYTINAMDTHLYINDNCVATLADFDKALGAYCRQHDVTIIERGENDV